MHFFFIIMAMLGTTLCGLWLILTVACLSQPKQRRHPVTVFITNVTFWALVRFRIDEGMAVAVGLMLGYLLQKGLPFARYAASCALNLPGWLSIPLQGLYGALNVAVAAFLGLLVSRYLTFLPGAMAKAKTTFQSVDRFPRTSRGPRLIRNMSTSCGSRSADQLKMRDAGRPPQKRCGNSLP